MECHLAGGNDTFLTFKDPKKEALRKHCGEKGENDGNQHFLYFPLCFYSIKIKIHCLNYNEMVIANDFNSGKSIFPHAVKGFTNFCPNTTHLFSLRTLRKQPSPARVAQW